MLSLTVLGSGTVDPFPQRASSGFHLQSAEHQIGIDLGAGTLRNAQLCGLEMWRLENLVLTHFHPDHTSDLVPFFLLGSTPRRLGGRVRSRSLAPPVRTSSCGLSLPLGRRLSLLPTF